MEWGVPDSKTRMKIRDVSLVVAGVAVLVWKGRYAGPYEVVVRSYGGNVSVSFAMYFLMLHLPGRCEANR